MEPSLKNTNILVTRPSASSLQLKALLEDTGACVDYWPAISIEYAFKDDLISEMKQTLGGQWIFTSQHAVYALYNAGINANNKPHLFLPYQVFAIGDSTAEIVKRYLGFEKVYVPYQASSESLLALPELVRTQKQVVILKGQGGRKYIPDKLKYQGRKVREINCYKRQPNLHMPDNTIMKRLNTLNGYDAIVFASFSALLNTWARLAREVDLTRLPITITNDRMKHWAQKQGFNHLISLKKPDNHTIKQTLLQYFGET